MEFTKCMLRRRSGRKYTQEPIADTDLHEILKAGLLAPSSRNLKSAEFLATTDSADLAALAVSKAAGAGMLKDAAAAILVIGSSRLSDAWIEDGSIAMTYMMLRATELGIANCWVQIRNRFSAVDGENRKRTAEEMIRERFDIPEGFSVLAVLSLGMPADQPAPHSWEDADFSRVHPV